MNDLKAIKLLLSSPTLTRTEVDALLRRAQSRSTHKAPPKRETESHWKPNRLKYGA